MDRTDKISMMAATLLAGIIAPNGGGSGFVTTQEIADAVVAAFEIDKQVRAKVNEAAFGGARKEDMVR
jgi:hypothetical protein